jgi:hypothetical protein
LERYKLNLIGESNPARAAYFEEQVALCESRVESYAEELRALKEKAWKHSNDADSTDDEEDDDISRTE